MPATRRDGLRGWVRSCLPESWRTRLRRSVFADDEVERFAHSGPRPEAGPAALHDAYTELFWSHDGNLVHKWHHYPGIYQRHLEPWRGRPVRVLEIGVFRGGSLELLRKFFGPEATIFGIDINPGCARFDGISGQVRIGSQDDAAFLADVVDEMGGIDIVIDDGSHVSPHIRRSFEVLYPRLSDGGLYIVEDTHACYWRSFGGGYRARTSFLEDVKTLIDDMHHWYHRHGERIAPTRGCLQALHVYDSLVVMEKGPVPAPRHSRVGSGHFLPKAASPEAAPAATGEG